MQIGELKGKGTTDKASFGSFRDTIRLKILSKGLKVVTICVGCIRMRKLTRTRIG